MRDRIVDTEFIPAAVRLACRAPSLHNSQPWRWRLDGTAVQLFIDAGWAPSPPIHRAGMRHHQLWRSARSFRVAMAASG